MPPKKIPKAEKPKSADAIKRERFEELIVLVTKTAQKKGWSAWIVSQDNETYQFATVAVERTAPGTYYKISATAEIVCDEKVSISLQGTSFYSYGIEDLRSALANEFQKLPWLEKKPKPDANLTISDIEIVKRFLRRFRQFARQLQHRHDERDPFVLNDEYDVQDVIHSVLRGLFDDIRTEEYVPSYAGGSSRMDFLLKKQQTVIEVKVASPTLRDKQIGEQLVIDIARYQTHPDCKTLICFIYDPLGHLRNPGGLEADLSKKQGEMTVMVIAASS